MAARDVRLAEVLGALSGGTDLGMGQPPGHGLRTSLIATAVAGRLGLAAGQCSDVAAVGLLRHLGCTADAEEVARFAGDELALAVAVAPHVMGDDDAEAAAVGRPGLAAARQASITAHCEAAVLLATRLGLGDDVAGALRHGFERWDGGGLPDGLAGPGIPVAARIAVVARDVDVWYRRGGLTAVDRVLRERRGMAYDPTVVDAFLGSADAVLAAADGDPWERFLDADPLRRQVPEAGLDRLLEVVADFADVKLGCTLGHSRAVAGAAEGAARLLGFGEETAVRLRRAGLVHDLGRVGVSSRVWSRPGPLTAEEFERVRLHPYLTERVLMRPAALRPLARLAGAHHERRDGSGYHRGTAGGTPEERVLAAADVHAALQQARPHRPALAPSAAAGVLAAEVSAGRLDARAVSAVAEAGSLPVGPLRPAWPDGLTDREAEVLGLACRGTSRAAVGRRLGISAKTVSRHLEHAYLKTGVTTRAGAALYAVDHGLLDGTP